MALLFSSLPAFLRVGGVGAVTTCCPHTLPSPCPPATDKEAALVAEVEAWGEQRPPRPEDLPAFPYAKAVFQESLRLYPPAPRVSCITASPAVLGGKHVPAGTMVQVSWQKKKK